MKAYITLVSTDDFVIGAITLFLSLKAVKAKYPFYVLLSPTVSLQKEQELKNCSDINVIRYKKSHIDDYTTYGSNGNHRWNNTFDKLAIFSLTHFSKLVFLDCDTYVIRNIDELFDLEHMSAVYIYNTYQNPYKDTKFCSGLLVIEPNENEYLELREQFFYTAHKHAISGVPFGDQNVLNDYYNKWDSDKSKHLYDEYNSMWGTMEKLLASKWTLTDKKGRTQIKVIHFSGLHKPWMNKTLFLIKTVIRSFRHYRKIPNFQALKVLLNYFNLVRKAKRLPVITKRGDGSSVSQSYH
ncbi:glycosyltransferase [Neobacillus citreus]|uniref:Glycosyl transferase n=1 Tax=Neobacillus citreus TaxID=2833578 RepID=A0A942T3P5_9BACI|nr:glycosyltransferase [Neobacillus citreus]MCH6266020.1 hypothetical protein [Neobacillus citreus]